MSSCEKRELTLSSDVKYVEFDAVSFSAHENSTNILKIPVYLTTTDKELKTEITFDTYGIGENIAVEGIDYKVINSNNKFTINGEAVYDTIYIELIDNEFFDVNAEDKMIQVDLKAASNGVKIGIDKPSSVIRIIDNDHPLSKFFGEYTVTSKTFGDFKPKDPEWVSTIVSVPGKIDEFDIQNIYFEDEGLNDIRVKVSDDNMVLTIYGGQVLLTHPIYGDAWLLKFMSMTEITDEDIVGHVNTEGTFSFNDWSISVKIGHYNAFTSTIWTKNN